MTPRELDAAIAEALGEVEANAPIGDGMTRTKTVYASSMTEANEELGRLYPRNLDTLRRANYVGPAYSTDPVAADALMQELVGRGWDVSIEKPVVVEHWYAAIWSHADATRRYVANADTWTHALARAALAALTADKED